jgi:glucuronoarabinoxylan endo-1,4-beta-xylanase
MAVSVGRFQLQAATCFVNGTDWKQTIDGFGFSSAWSGAISTAQADALFGTAGFSLLRIRIDPNRSWANETANSSTAHGRGARVMGTAWTPPASMKDNNNVVGGNLRTDQYAAYATFLSQAANSIGLDYVSFQNEPDITVTYESCHWTPGQMQTFCRNNAQNIGRPVIMPESFHFDDAYSDPTLNDSTAASHIAIVGGHIYGGGNFVHQNAINKGKRVWQTEHFHSGTSIGTCLNIAKEVSDCMNNQMNAYYWWWIAQGDAASLISGSTLLKNGYTLGQFAKWIRPGKQRIGATYNPTSNVFVTAYRNNGLVIVAVNTGGSSVSQTFTLQNISGVTTLLTHRTSSSQNMAQITTANVSNNSFTYTLPAQSVTTFHQF